MNVEALNCPNCGSGVPSDAAHCEFCRSRLKTVGCTSCLGLMFVGSQFCGRCGAIAAPVLALDEDAAGSCPRCRKTLETVRLDRNRLAACKSCDGVWMEAGEFESVCAESERQSVVLGYLRKRTAKGPARTKVNYVPCPQCGQLMNRNNFAKASGVIVDICKKHGVWLDADELPTIIEFIRKGGMELARQRELNAIAQEREKLRDEQRRAARGQSIFGSRDESDGTRSFVRGLFDF
jgi:Zn-finger nucleic acid-binding protein